MSATNEIACHCGKLISFSHPNTLLVGCPHCGNRYNSHSKSLLLMQRNFVEVDSIYVKEDWVEIEGKRAKTLGRTSAYGETANYVFYPIENSADRRSLVIEFAEDCYVLTEITAPKVKIDLTELAVGEERSIADYGKLKATWVDAIKHARISGEWMFPEILIQRTFLVAFSDDTDWKVVAMVALGNPTVCFSVQKMQRGAVAFPEPKTITCPHCSTEQKQYMGAGLKVFGCTYCSHVFKLEGENYVQQIRGKVLQRTTLNLGDKVTLDSVPYLVSALVMRSDTSRQNTWMEYQLYNPNRPFTSLSENNGHWHLMWEEPTPAEKKNMISHKGLRFQLYANEPAVFLGMAGNMAVDTAGRGRYTELIAPPYIISKEKFDNFETTYAGRYVTKSELKAALVRQVDLPISFGTGAAEEVLKGFNLGALFRIGFGYFVLMLVLAIFQFTKSETYRMAATKVSEYRSASQTASTSTEQLYRPDSTSSPQPVAPYFKEVNTLALKDAYNLVRIDLEVPILNNWVYAEGYLLNEATGETFNFARDLEYYEGTDSDGKWSEGSCEQRLYISNIPQGTYKLFVRGESPKWSDLLLTCQATVSPFVFSTWFLHLLLGLIPIGGMVAFKQWREYLRWFNSEYTPGE